MTGLLYLIVVVMWAAVLVPIWLKSHDRAQVEKVLREEGAPSIKWRWQHREPLSPRELAFRRRRRSSMTLFTGLAAAIVLSATGYISAYWIAMPTILIVGFLAVVAKNAKHAAPQIALPQSQDDSGPRTQFAIPTHRTEVIAVTEVVTETNRTWHPIETPLPSYVSAEKATTFSRVLDAEKPWTGQEMLEQAEILKAQRAARIQDSQKRLEEARAIAMEKARKAALAAAQTYPEVAEKRAVNE